METAQARWDNLYLHRSLYLRRAIDASKLTIPTLIPESDQNDGWTGDRYNAIPSLYQGAGARGVNGLSSQLMLALYPPSVPFFRLTIDSGALMDYAQRNGEDEVTLASKMDAELSKIERRILLALDQLQARSAIFEALKHLVVGGNALLYIGQESVRMYGLRSFCVDRDPEGNITEIVVREQVSDKYLPPGASKDDDSDERQQVYTHVNVDGDNDKVSWYQELHGKKISGSSGFSRLETSPWLVLRLNKIAGESYGRGIVEECLGDLQSLESLSQAIVEGSLIAAKAIGLVNPNGVTRADTLSRAKNGSIVAGNAADVEFLQVQKQNDFSTALQTMQLLERRLDYTFLNMQAIQRDAERVTAEEIRLMAESLEKGLGGVYTLLAAELQLPLIRRVMHIMQNRGDLPPIPEGLVEPQATTGLEAIGRGNDKARLTSFLTTIATALGPEQFLQYIQPEELIRRFAAADGIDVDGLVKTAQQMEAERAQAEQAMLAQQLAQGAVSSGVTASPQPGREGAGQLNPGPAGGGPAAPGQGIG